MKRIVILKGSFIDSIEEYVLKECLKIMFPECNVEIRLVPAVNSPEEKNIRSLTQVSSIYKQGKRDKGKQPLKKKRKQKITERFGQMEDKPETNG
jgi:hypothetical protein